MKQITALLAGVAISAVAATAASAQTKWDMPTPYGDGNFHTKNVVQFTKDVEKATGGKLTITVHSNGSLIKHPNLVEIHELGQIGTDLFLVMEYLAGENLSGLMRRLVARDEKLGYALAAHVVAEACLGLHAAHVLTDESGKPLDVVHRDVSPQNLFVTYGGQVKVLDFGIATAAHRLTQTATGQLKGKFSYMSPEQCRGEPLDARSDIFSLGVVLFELSMLRRLFKRPSELMVLKAVTEEPVPRPSREDPEFPKQLEGIIMRALARDKEQRTQSALEMHDALREVITNLGYTKTELATLLEQTMQRLFADRMREKKAMLSNVRAGTDFGMLPSVEVDESIEVPGAREASRSVSMQRPASTVPTAEVSVRPRGRGALIALAAACALAIGGAVTWRLGVFGTNAEPGAPPPAGTLSAPTSSSVAAASVAAAPAPAAQPAAATAASTTVQPAAAAVEPAPAAHLTPPPAPADTVPATVVVTIDSNPKGATVVIAGVVRGVTPVDVDLPRGTDPVALVLRGPGLQPLTQELVPDRDQRFVLALTPKPVKRTPPPRPAPPKKKDDGGFKRFD